MVKIPISSEHLVPDISFLKGRKILFIKGTEDWSMNDHTKDVKEYVAILQKNNKFTFTCIKHENYDRWGGDLPNYPDCHPETTISEWQNEKYEEVVSQCEYEFCYISRRYNNIEYSTFFTPPTNDWEWDELSEDDLENERLHNYILDKLCRELKEFKEKNK